MALPLPFLQVSSSSYFTALVFILGAMVVSGVVILNAETVRVRSSVSKNESLETKLSYKLSNTLIHHDSFLLINLL